MLITPCSCEADADPQSEVGAHAYHQHHIHSHRTLIQTTAGAALISPFAITGTIFQGLQACKGTCGTYKGLARDMKKIVYVTIYKLKAPGRGMHHLRLHTFQATLKYWKRPTTMWPGTKYLRHQQRVLTIYAQIWGLHLGLQMKRSVSHTLLSISKTEKNVIKYKLLEEMSRWDLDATLAQRWTLCARYGIIKCHVNIYGPDI